MPVALMSWFSTGLPSERRTHCTARWKTSSQPRIACSTAALSRTEPSTIRTFPGAGHPPDFPASRREIVEDGHPVAARDQPVNEMASDESRAARDQDPLVHRVPDVVVESAQAFDGAQADVERSLGHLQELHTLRPMRPSRIDRSSPGITRRKCSTTPTSGS